jgi:hypothetical protein
MMTIMRMRSAILTIAYCISAIFENLFSEHSAFPYPEHIDRFFSLGGTIIDPALSSV